MARAGPRRSVDCSRGVPRRSLERRRGRLLHQYRRDRPSGADAKSLRCRRHSHVRRNDSAIESRVPNALAVKIRRLPTSEGLSLPEYQTAGSAGMDLHAAVKDDVEIAAGEIRFDLTED